VARSQSVAAARAAQFSGSLEVHLDSDEQIRIKTKPMFVRELRKILREIKDSAREDVVRRHFRTGRLMSSIQAQVSDISTEAGGRRISGTVSAGSRLARYAWYVHEGTRPHIIRAKPGGVLAFVGHSPIMRQVKVGRRLVVKGVKFQKGGKTFQGHSAYDDVYEAQSVAGVERKVVVKEVHHPGYRGDRFLNVAAAKVVSRYGGRVNLPRRSGTP